MAGGIAARVLQFGARAKSFQARGQDTFSEGRAQCERAHLGAGILDWKEASVKQLLVCRSSFKVFQL